MTSRGCPWACTFCGAETTWGRGFRGQSVSYVLDGLEKASSRLPVKMIQIKDDTFTTNKKRVMECAPAFANAGWVFLELRHARRSAHGAASCAKCGSRGANGSSLGVESGSQRILDAIDKKITGRRDHRSTELAKKVGIRVRYYMMLGNRGETAETFNETLAFLQKAKPHQYIFSCLSIYPGTRDFDAAEQAGWLDREVLFAQNSKS